ncbi:hypothetical protein LQZ24_00745 [Fructobacillus sp. M1-13]|uniref:Uncharacterized protein n=1 Tax=Fructobacillus papyriferae TaxID=2713171 RepID=A0ABS5QNC8_9LACO|nr:hypothetical protein [Fructobacillus papyriferae]MBS9334566.1 hypothetical protein [Fructobacillus papyriferae]MCD2158555.1 hypothetical protein [Fructobacillus papyriferae]
MLDPYTTLRRLKRDLDHCVVIAVGFGGQKKKAVRRQVMRNQRIQLATEINRMISSSNDEMSHDLKGEFAFKVSRILHDQAQHVNRLGYK